MHKLPDNLEVGDRVRLTRYVVGRLTAHPSRCTEKEGQEGVVLSITNKYTWGWPEARVRLFGGYIFTVDDDNAQIELVSKGNGTVTPGVDYQFTERELQQQRFDAFCARIQAKDQRFSGFRNAATFLAHLYLDNNRSFHDWLPGMRRQDGTLNPNKVMKAFRHLGLRIDDWALSCPIDIPPEFAGWNLPHMPCVDWAQVAAHFHKANIEEGTEA